MVNAKYLKKISDATNTTSECVVNDDNLSNKEIELGSAAKSFYSIERRFLEALNVVLY